MKSSLVFARLSSSYRSQAHWASLILLLRYRAAAYETGGGSRFVGNGRICIKFVDLTFKFSNSHSQHLVFSGQHLRFGLIEGTFVTRWESPGFCSSLGVIHGSRPHSRRCCTTGCAGSMEGISASDIKGCSGITCSRGRRMCHGVRGRW